MKTKEKAYNIILLSFLGILFLIGTMGSVQNIITVLLGDKTQGIVVDSTHYGSGKYYSWITKISYSDGNNNTYTLQTTGQFQPMHTKGDVVTIFYDKKNPGKAVELSAFILIDLFVCAIFLFFIIFAIVKFSKEK